MADGRYDSERLIKAVEQNAAGHLLFDMEAAAKAAGAIVNSVMLGAIAGLGRLPIPAEAFEAAIKHDGKAVESNLRGFRAGLAAAQANAPAVLKLARQARREADLAELEAKAAAASGRRACARHRRRAPPRRVSGCRSTRAQYLNWLEAVPRPTRS